MRTITFLLVWCFPLASFLAQSQSNEGREFWLGFMQHRNVNNNSKVVMITSKTNTSGTVRVPLKGWSQDFIVAANQVSLVFLPAYTETLGSEIVTENGVQITTQNPVSVYSHQYHSYRSEATVVLPTPSLGREYFAMTYNGQWHQGQPYPPEFLIVAVEDGTEVTIMPTTRTERGNLAPFTITLEAGETYQVRTADPLEDLTGSYVIGNKDFAFFGGSTWAEVPSGCPHKDNLLEQMHPVPTWGKQFVTIPHKMLNRDIFRILAAEDNTVVEVQDSNPITYTLNAGEFIEYEQSEASYITSNRPIQVAQFIIGSTCNGHSLGDPSMTLLNSVQQTRDTVTLHSSAFQEIEETYINIIVQTDDRNSVTFDGQPLAQLGEQMQTVGINADFSYLQLEVRPGSHTIISEGCGVIASAYGYGYIESYAYSGGANFVNINANPIPEGGCLNDTIFFDTGLSPKRFSFDWDLGDGTTTTAAKFQHQYAELGEYPVRLIVRDECLGTEDTLRRDLQVTLRQAVDVEPDILVCEGEAVSLSATDLPGAAYKWLGPNGYRKFEQFPVLESTVPDMSGAYAVTGTISGCATFPATTEVLIVPTPNPQLGPDTIICTAESGFALELFPGKFAQYWWQNGARNATFTVRQEGEYSVEVADRFGCTAADTVFLQELCPTQLYVPSAFSPNGDDENDEFQAYGRSIISFQLAIFNRWGVPVFETDDPAEAWDGNWKGEPASVGVYVWQIQLEGYREDGSIYSEVLSGDVTLVR